MNMKQKKEYVRHLREVLGFCAHLSLTMGQNSDLFFGQQVILLDVYTKTSERLENVQLDAVFYLHGDWEIITEPSNSCIKFRYHVI